MYDVIIIGSGVAGLSTAIYAGSRSLKTAIFEKKENVGGVIHGVSNVTHFPGVSYNERGDEFVEKIKEQVDDAGVETIFEEVQKVDLKAQFALLVSLSLLVYQLFAQSCFPAFSLVFHLLY